MTAATLKSGFDTKSWVRRLGTYGFMFFLVKGLLWLAVPLILYQGL